MGILSQILANGKKIIPPPEIENAAIEKSIQAPGTRPDRPCPAGHPPPYGYHHWMDIYGVWRCTECRPPASAAMAKEEFLAGNSPQNSVPAAVEDFFLANGIVIAAISCPDGVQVFHPDIPQTERREIVKNLKWFDRNDARPAVSLLRKTSVS